MKFYEVGVGTDFQKANDTTIYTKVKEERISCCKVKCNAINKQTNESIVFKPMDDIEVVTQ